MTKFAIGIPTIWVSSIWGEAWSAFLLFACLAFLVLAAAWKMRQIESEDEADAA